MRIAIIVPSLANKGPVIVAKNLVDFFIKQGEYCEVFYFTDIVELDFSCKTTKISLFDFAKVKGFDIIHSHGIRPDLYSFLNIYKGFQRITTLHNYMRKDLETSLGYSRVKSKIIELIWNTFLMRMDKIVVLSKDAKVYYRNILFNKNIEVVYNGLSPKNKKMDIDEKELFDTLYTEGYQIMGTSALLTHRKGLHQIIEALPFFENMVFVVVGDGPEKQSLIELAKKINVESRCLFLGYKSNAVKYLNYYDYFVIPSYSEGFPLALIEAAAFKKPVLASNINIHREVFNKNEISFTELDNLESMKEALEYLIKNQTILSKNIYDKYIENYTLEVMGRNYLFLYKNIILN